MNYISGVPRSAPKAAVTPTRPSAVPDTPRLAVDHHPSRHDDRGHLARHVVLLEVVDVKRNLSRDACRGKNHRGPGTFTMLRREKKGNAHKAKTRPQGS